MSLEESICNIVKDLDWNDITFNRLFELGQIKIIVIGGIEYRIRFDGVWLKSTGMLDTLYDITFIDIETWTNSIREEFENGACGYHRDGWKSIVWIVKHLKN